MGPSEDQDWRYSSGPIYRRRYTYIWEGPLHDYRVAVQAEGFGVDGDKDAEVAVGVQLDE